MEKYQGPILKLGTLVMAIQTVDHMMHTMGPEQNTADDQLWYNDLSLAADDLEDVYKTYIEKSKMINAPAYDSLVRKKD